MFNLKIDSGLTRTVLLTDSVAIKFPNIRFGWKFFLMGMVANLQEKHIYKNYNFHYNCLCPVIFSFFGLFLIMKRVDKYVESDEEIISLLEFGFDRNIENYGYIKNKLVIFDYGINIEYQYCPKCKNYLDIILKEKK